MTDFMASTLFLQHAQDGLCVQAETVLFLVVVKQPFALKAKNVLHISFFCKDNNLFLSCSRFDKKNIESLHMALKPCNPFLTLLSTILSFLVNVFKLLCNAVLTTGA